MQGGRDCVPSTFRRSRASRPILFCFKSLRTLLRSFALFCTPTKLNSSLFKRFRTLSQKLGVIPTPLMSGSMMPIHRSHQMARTLGRNPLSDSVPVNSVFFAASVFIPIRGFAFHLSTVDLPASPCFFTSLPHCFYPFLMRENSKMFATVEEAVEEIRQGRMVVLVDDEDRENEGDLALAAEKITPDAINFMAKYGRGLICLPLTEERCDELHLPLMSPINTSAHGTAFCEAIDGRLGVTTGISASDRAMTILTAVDPKTKPQDLARPGHIFPPPPRNAALLARAHHPEPIVHLAPIAGLSAAGVICEIMNEDGTMSRVPQLVEFCKEHNLKMLTVADLIRYRMQHERYVRRVAEAVLPTRFGDFRMIAYASDVDHDQHVALVRG